MDRIGRYKIVRELGRGAMGVVYHAIDPNIGRPVAIKTIRLTEVATGDEQKRLRERLFREARSAGMLSHPGIVTIYDVEEQDGLAYIAMEYVDGPTLDQVLSGPEAITPEGMFSILAQTAAALDYAHGKSIVHRDIKPANIMITADGTAKIADFGIAKITTSEQFTMTGSIVGTPHYMSPEQIQGHAVDGRSDQFSLAVIAYEMLTGEKPYTGEHLTTVVYKIVAEEPAAPRRLNPTLTPAIETALRKGLAKRPENRYKNCQEFASGLEAACGESKGWKMMPRSGMLNEPTIADVQAGQTSATGTLPPPKRSRRAEASLSSTTVGAEKRKSGFLTFLLAILVVAGLLVLIGWQAMPWLTPPPVRQDPQLRAQAPVSTPAPVETPPATVPTPAPAPAETPTAVTAAPAPEDAKPSALGQPPQPQPQPPPKKERVVETASGGAPQEVQVLSSPSGATARLDGNPAISCTTPCTLSASPGRHTVVISAPGHLMESREIIVGHGPLEMTPVMLRQSGGTVMLSSTPDHATVTVNGRRYDQLTPATLTLAPGSYQITVEKDGRQFTDTVVVKEGLTVYRKVTLN
jgi:serine/threonine protein kinase